MPDFSTIAAPLTRLTSKEVPFVWNLDAEQSFNRLKEELSTAPILAFPKEVGEFILDTDASDIGVGAVLQQMQDNEERVIAYASIALNWFTSYLSGRSQCWALQRTFDPTPGIPQEHDSTTRRLSSVYPRQATHLLFTKNGPVESECKLNNVNPHIIRNQIQIK